MSFIWSVLIRHRRYKRYKYRFLRNMVFYDHECSHEIRCGADLYKRSHNGITDEFQRHDNGIIDEFQRHDNGFSTASQRLLNGFDIHRQRIIKGWSLHGFRCGLFGFSLRVCACVGEINVCFCLCFRGFWYVTNGNSTAVLLYRLLHQKSSMTLSVIFNNLLTSAQTTSYDQSL